MVLASTSRRAAKVVFYVDGARRRTDRKRPYTFSLDTHALANGEHSLEVTGTFRSGKSRDVSKRFTVSNAEGRATEVDQPDALPLLLPSPHAAATGSGDRTARAAVTQPAPPPSPATSDPARAPASPPPARPTGKTLYVSPSGSDTNPGTQAAPWRTVAKVNGAALAPADTVAFQGGASFAGQLAPNISGTATAPITYTSYGTGQATFPSGISLRSISNIVFESIAVSRTPTKGITSSGSGTGAKNILFNGLSVTDMPLMGIVAESGLDSNWTIQNSTIARTQDSGIILWGNGHIVQDSTIVDVGLNLGLTYDAHGIYSKTGSIKILRNEIARVGDAGGQAISTRYRNALIEGNRIHHVRYAIGYWRDDPGTGGITTVRYNRFWNVSTNGSGSAVGINISPQGNTVAGMVEDWQIYNNTWIGTGSPQPGGVVRNTTTGRSIILRNNAVSGFAEIVEGGSNATVSNNLLSANLGLSAAPALVPQAGSALIDAGTASITPDVTITANCDGAPMHYCGTGPSVGAVEETG